ncbi:hypothetical protein [Orenia metallireducens]|uniref:hypothetical protein n=1 Tax=Orenia metallireducens TaxID=1413210 RepID=UPI00159F175B|nr:hypothetical protein [Orenia metallireducens]
MVLKKAKEKDIEKIVISMLKKGIEVEEIIQMTDLYEEEIYKIKDLILYKYELCKRVV